MAPATTSVRATRTSILVRCSCGKRQCVPRRYEGKRVRCPRCREGVRVTDSERRRRRSEEVLVARPVSDPTPRDERSLPSAEEAVVPTSLKVLGIGLQALAGVFGLVLAGSLLLLGLLKDGELALTIVSTSHLPGILVCLFGLLLGGGLRSGRRWARRDTVGLCGLAIALVCVGIVAWPHPVLVGMLFVTGLAAGGVLALAARGGGLLDPEPKELRRFVPPGADGEVARQRHASWETHLAGIGAAFQGSAVLAVLACALFEVMSTGVLGRGSTFFGPNGFLLAVSSLGLYRLGCGLRAHEPWARWSTVAICVAMPLVLTAAVLKAGGVGTAAAVAAWGCSGAILALLLQPKGRELFTPAYRAQLGGTDEPTVPRSPYLPVLLGVALLVVGNLSAAGLN